MSAKSPWSVKGISPEERELAKVAARRAGVPIGQWLSQQIRAASAGGPLHVPGPQAIAGMQPMAPASVPASVPGPAPVAGPVTAAGSGVTPITEPRPSNEPSTGSASRDRRFGFGGGFGSGFKQSADAPPASRRGDGAAEGGVSGSGSGGGLDPLRVKALERDVRHLRDLEVRVERLQGAEKRIAGLSTRLQEMVERVDHVESHFENRLNTILEQRVDAAARDPSVMAVDPVKVEVPADLLRRLDRIEEDMTEVKARPVGGGSDDSVTPVTAPIERAVMRLSERLQRVESSVLMDKGPRQGFFARLFGRGGKR